MTDESSPPPISPHREERSGPRWPRTVGIIAIVFAILGLFQALVGLVSLFLTRQQMGGLASGDVDPKQIDEYLDDFSSLTYLGAIVYALLGAILLIGGILLLKRRRDASTILQAWSVLKLVAGGFLLFRHTSLTRVQMDIMTQSGAFGPGSGSDLVDRVTSISIWAGFAFGVLWLAALPVFLLIWLNRARIRADIRSW